MIRLEPRKPEKRSRPNKTISRASSRKSRTSRKESAASKIQGQSSDSESEADEVKARGSDLDLMMVDISNEKDWDTDLEADEPPSTYDHTGKSAYVDACKKFGVVPASYFLRHMNESSLSMRHHGLAGDGMKAIAASLVSNATINSLDISDNWLGVEGGSALCDMLKENCFITELNCSDNNLQCCVEQLCNIIEQNDTLRKVNLSGNNFDDTSAEHISNLIMYATKLESLNLSHNHLGEKSGILIGPAISENACIKELDLSWNHIRRKGAMAIGAGIKNNIYMKKVNLSWNGFGLDGAIALQDALKANSVLEELDITNNRITTEGAVLIGKGLTINETLKTLKMGKNPMQSAGCWGVAAAILKNPSCILENIDFNDVMVNKDFSDIWKQVEETFPSIKLTHGATKRKDVLSSEPMLRPKRQVHPMAKLIAYITSHKVQLTDFFQRFDKDGNMNISRDEFKQGLEEAGINLTPEETETIVSELDANDDGEINYSELVLGQTEYQENERKISMTALRPMTS